MASSKKLIDYTGNLATVNVPTAVGTDMVRAIAPDAFENTTVKTAIIDTYANDIDVSQVTGVQVLWNKEPKCTISYDANGGSGTMTDQTANIGMVFILPACTFTYTGKKFTGWSIDNITYQPGDNYAFAGDTIVKALWALDTNPLCFTANEAGSTVAMDGSALRQTPTLGQNFQYSFDKNTWYEFTVGTTTITLSNIGDKVYFKGNNPNGITENWYIVFRFLMTGSIAASGNIMSLIDNGACNTYTIPGTGFCFASMFQKCSSLTSAPELPATTLGWRCYEDMFNYCSGLTYPPKLPATNLSELCYAEMFQYCTSLVSVPELPATILKDGCYDNMFTHCSALYVSESSGEGYTIEWKIPTTGVGSGDYEMWYMFYDCLGTRSENHPKFNGIQKIYFTQNSPI